MKNHSFDHRQPGWKYALGAMLFLLLFAFPAKVKAQQFADITVSWVGASFNEQCCTDQGFECGISIFPNGDPDPRWKLRAYIAGDPAPGYSFQGADNAGCPGIRGFNVPQFSRTNVCGPLLVVQTQSWEEDGFTGCGADDAYDPGCLIDADDDFSTDVEFYDYQNNVPQSSPSNRAFNDGNRGFTLQIEWQASGPSAPLVSTPAVSCINSRATLSVTSALTNPSNFFAWFSDAGLTNQVGTGTTFTTPILTGPVSFWVAEAGLNNLTVCKGQSNRVDLVPLAGSADPTANGVTICEGQTAFLEAFGEDGATFTWYDSADLTHAIQVGAQYTTQPLTTNTSFWVTQQQDGLCPSAAVEVVVTVNPPADLAFGVGDYTICEGQTIPAGEGLTATCSDFGPGGSSSSSVSGTASFPIAIGPDAGDGGSASFDASGIPAGSTVTNVSLTATLSHTYASDVTIEVVSPSASSVFVHDQNGGNDNFGNDGPPQTTATYTWDDAGPLGPIDFTSGDLDIPAGSYFPVEPLAAFNGEPATGNWTVNVGDVAAGDGGQLTSATLRIAYNLPPDPGSLTWWDDATGGTQVGTGSPFVPAGYQALAPGVYTFYAQCDDASTCDNRRVPVTFTVLPAIASPIVRGDDLVCAGETATMTVANPAGTVEWYADAALSILLYTGTTYTSAPLATTTTFYVVNNNGVCGSEPTEWTVTVNEAPEQPQIFTDIAATDEFGNLAICEDQVGTFQVFLEDPDNEVAFVYTESEPADPNSQWLFFAFDGETFEINTQSDMIYYVRTFNIATGCFSKPVPLYINVFDRPNPAQVRGTTVCVGEEATIYADISIFFDNTGANTQNTVYWTDEEGFFIDIHPIPLTPPGPPYIFNDSLNVGSFGTPGVYNFFVTTSNDYCYSTPQIVTVTVLARPEAPVAEGATICEGDDVVLTASCSGDIRWYADIDLTNLVHVGSEFPVSGATSNTTYYVTCKNGDCESDATEVTITVNPKPEPPTPELPFYTVCYDESAELFASNTNGDAILWYDDPQGLIEWSTDSSGAFVTPELTQAAIFYAAAVDVTTGCRSDLVPVQVFPTPKFEHPRVEDVEVCASGDSVTLKAHISFPRDLVIDFFDFFTFSNAIVRFVNTANGLVVFGDVPVELDPFNDIWEGDATLTIPAVDPGGDWDFTVPGSYDIGARTANFWFNLFTGDLFECSSDYGTGTVTVLEPPVAPVVSNTSPACERDNVTVSAEPVIGGIYNWTGPNGFSSNAQQFTLTNVTLAQAGTYTLVVTDLNGCQSEEATTEVIVNPAPVVDTAYADPNPLCEHQTLNLFVEVDGQGDYTYEWKGPNGYTSTDQNPTIADVTEADNQGFYSVVVTDDVTGCTSLPYVILVEINTFPDRIIADNDGPVCEGGTINLNATNVFDATYTWTGPNGYTANGQHQTLTNVTPDMSGTYTVTITLNGGCADSATTEVIVWPNPVADAGEDDTTYQDDPIVLNGSGGTTYQWVPNTYLDQDNIPNPIFNSPDVGTFPIVLTVWDDNHGCSDKDTVVIVVLPKLDLQIPDLITPNGDGVNDNWIIKYLENIRDPYTLTIYARGGAKVYSTTAYSNDWNGTYDGKELPDGGYWFVLAIDGGKTYKGSITIKR